MTKKLTILLIVLAVVILLTVTKKNMSLHPTDMATEAGMQTLLPEAVLASELRKVELFVQAKPDDKVVLSRTKDGWQLDSAFAAPGDKAKIDGFCAMLKSLSGELRPAAPEILGDFNLNEQQALHVKLHYGEKELVYLLVGKQVGTGNASFVRQQQDTGKVYMVAKEIRREVGLWGNDTAKSPETNYWLDKKFLKLEKEKISGIALEYPDKKLTFVRDEKKPTEEPKTDTKPDDKKPDEKKPDEKKPKEYEWRLAEGGLGKKVKPAAIESFFNALTNNFEGSDVVDPKDTKKWGLATPQFRMTLTLQDNAKYVLLAGVPESGKDAYCMLEGKPGLIYKVTNNNFTELFKKGKDWIDLPKLDIAKDQMKELEITRPEGSVVLSRTIEKPKDDKKDGQQEEKTAWSVLVPATTLLVAKEKADDLLSKLTPLKAEDYTDETNPAALGLATTEYRLTVTMKDDSKHTVLIGKPSATIEGVYAMLDGDKNIYALTKYDYEAMFPEYVKLFVPELLNVQLHEFSLLKDNTPFTLRKSQEQWVVVQGEQTTPANPVSMERLAKLFAPLKATAIAFHQNNIASRKAIATVTVRGTRDQAILSIYEKHDGEKLYPVVFVDAKECFWLEEETVKLLLLPADEYQLKPEPSKEDKPEIPKKDEPKTEDKKE